MSTLSKMSRVKSKIERLLLIFTLFCAPAFAATVTNGVVTASTTNTSTGTPAYTSGSFTPAANDLLVVMVVTSGTTDAEVVTDSQSGTYTRVGRTLYSSSANSVLMFVANQLVPSASATTVTVSPTKAYATGMTISVARIASMSRVGLAAVKQVATGLNKAASTTPTLVFGSAVATGDVVIGIVGNSTSAATLTPPTSFTEQSDTGYSTPSTGSEYVSINSGFTGTTVTWGSTSGSVFGDIVAEFDTSAAPTAGTPTLVQTNADPNTMTLGTINAMQKGLPNGAQTGNTFIQFETTDNNPITCVPNSSGTCVTDDQSDSYSLLAKSARDGTSLATIYAHISTNVASGASTISTAQNSGGAHNTIIQTEWANISGAPDGAGSSAVISASTTSIACGSFTPSNNGDLIWQAVYIPSFTSTPTGSVTFTPGTGFTPINEDGTAFFYTQYKVQATAGAINPTVTLSQATSDAVTVCGAIKPNVSGSVPTGLYVNSAQIINASELAATASGTTLSLQFPCSGNSLWLNWEGWHTQTISSITDDQSNSWSSGGAVQYLGGSPTASGMQWWHTDSASCGSGKSVNLTITFAARPVGDTNGNNTPIFEFVDIGNSGGQDATAGAVGDTNTSGATSGTITWANSITPTNNGSAILCGQQEDNNTVTALSSSGSFTPIILNPSSPNINELDASDKDGGYMNFTQVTATAYTPAWVYSDTNGATTIGNWWGQCVAVAPVTAAITKPHTLTTLGVGL